MHQTPPISLTLQELHAKIANIEKYQQRADNRDYAVPEDYLVDILKLLEELRRHIIRDQRTIATWLVSERPGSPQLTLEAASRASSISKSRIDRWKKEDAPTYKHEGKRTKSPKYDKRRKDRSKGA